MRLDHLSYKLATLELSGVRIMRGHLELVGKQSATDLKFVGTDKLETESKAKEFRKKLLSWVYV